MGTDAYTQEELAEAVRGLKRAFGLVYVHVRKEDWVAYRKSMRDIDLRYRQLRSQGPGLGAEPTRQ